MKNPTSLCVRHVTVLAEHIRRSFILSVDHGHRFIASAGDSFKISIQAVEHLVSAIFVTCKKMSVVGCKALIEPDVAPVFTGHKVTKPLMSEFMGYKSLAAS